MRAASQPQPVTRGTICSLLTAHIMALHRSHCTFHTIPYPIYACVYIVILSSVTVQPRTPVHPAHKASLSHTFILFDVQVLPADECKSGGAGFTTTTSSAATTERFNLKRSPYLPISNGDNKYFENMMPGYSGDVPRWPYKFGATYRNICDEASESLVREYDRTAWKAENRQRAASMFPRLRPGDASTAAADRQRDHMNRWTDQLTRENRAISNKGNPEEVRGPTEAPMPGYTGYVPRTPCTDIALGLRYHDGSKKGFEAFHGSVKQHFNRLAASSSAPLSQYAAASLAASSSGGVATQRTRGADPSKAARRIFHQEGMIPLYTGHMHVIKDKYGRTYGDTTRSLEVCKHPFSSYGESTILRQANKDQQLIPV